MDAAEINMIKKNKTWILVNRPNNHNVIGVKWIFRTKLNLDGSVNKYKAILVVKGFAQVYGVDYMETFPPVTRHDTIRLKQQRWLLFFFWKWGVYLGSKKQEVVAQSSAAEAEYIATASTVNQALWLRKILAELGFSQNEGILLNVDNQSTMEIAKNPMRHGRTKHIRVKFHALRKAMREGEVWGVYLGSKKQEVVAQSSAAEAEYIATASTVNQALWLRKILAELGFSQNEGILLNVDNQSTMEIAKNPMRHGRTKHIRVKFHALRKAMREGEVVLEYCQTDEQVADIFTKGLSVNIFCIFEKQIGCLPNWNQGGVLKTQ
ncbi:Reverse transcriptase [Theobroma cacao]|nr:Reverse transcriptase [Theobroma cacao]